MADSSISSAQVQAQGEARLLGGQQEHAAALPGLLQVQLQLCL